MSRGSTRTIWVYPLLLLALACLFVISVLIGSVDIAMGDVWRVLVDPGPCIDSDSWVNVRLWCQCDCECPCICV